MFTIDQIETAHSKVKSGADFPNYIKEIRALGVLKFETWVIDSHTEYFGKAAFQIQSNPKYAPLNISETSQKNAFENYLKSHQKGETDYFTFCQHCAETGIEKWVVDLEQSTCTYFDKANNKILTENIPLG